jgi:hypothetical protein
MIRAAQRGGAGEVEVTQRRVMATTSDSPDNSIESRKKSTEIKTVT